MTITGTEELDWLEGNPVVRLASNPAAVAISLRELRDTNQLKARIALLSEWSIRFQNATALLLVVIERSPEVAAELATTVLGCGTLEEDQLDGILSSAFPYLTGAVREAAADRGGVRALLGLQVGVGYTPVLAPDPGWLWPKGEPFPSPTSIEGIQARLNYVGLGAGPVTGEWNERTAIAFRRWQVLNGFDSTIDRDYRAIEGLGLRCPSAPG